MTKGQQPFVIASGAKQSRAVLRDAPDCFVAPLLAMTAESWWLSYLFPNSLLYDA